MKKILLSLALIGLIGMFALPALAQTPDSCTLKRDPGIGSCPVSGNVNYSDAFGVENTTGAMCCLFGTINYIIDWLFMIIMILVVILILLGAFTLVTASGSEEGVKKGRNYIVFALVGVAVALLARALPYLIRSIMGVTG